MSAEEAAGIYARESPYLERYIQLGVASGKVIDVSFPAAPEDEAESDHEFLDRVFAYLEGDRPDLASVPVALTLPTDQQAVLEVVREIPYGEDVNVEQAARMTPGLDPEDDEDLTLVRTALDANPVPIFVPDHRVRDGPSAAPAAVEQRLRSLEGL